MKIGNYRLLVVNEWKYILTPPFEFSLFSIHLESDYKWVTIFNISFLMERD